MASRTATDLDFLAANVHGRRSRLAEADRLDELCRVRSLPELAQRVLPGEQVLSVEDLQRRLVLAQVHEMAFIAARLDGASGHLLDWLCARFQMENIKVLARGFSRGLALDELRLHLVPLGGGLAFEEEVLGAADSIEAFAAAVLSPPLREGIERAIPLYRERPRPFFVEAGLDHGYLVELLARARRVPAADQRDVLQIARQEADTFHLALVVRGKFHYGLDLETLMTFHVSGSRISQNLFQAMVRAEHLSEVASMADGVAIDASPGELTDAATLEILAWNRYLRVANWVFRRSHMGLGAVVAFEAVRRVELANLIRLSEGIRAGLSPDDIRRRLIPRTDLSAARARSGEPLRV